MNQMETLALEVLGGAAYLSVWLPTSRMFYTKWRAGWMDKAIRNWERKLEKGGHEVEVTEDHLVALESNYRQSEAQGGHKFSALVSGALWPVTLTVHHLFRDPQPSLLEARVRQQVQERHVRDLEARLDAELTRSARILEKRDQQ
jgi:hypothetical protein